MTPAMSHEKIAAGPAMTEALNAPKSQPEPMIEPTLAKSSPTTPTWRLSCGSDVSVAVRVSDELVMGGPSVVADGQSAPRMSLPRTPDLDTGNPAARDPPPVAAE